MMSDDEKRKAKLQLKAYEDKLMQIAEEHGQKWGRGVMEATEERFAEIYNKLIDFFNKENLPVTIKRRLAADLEYVDGYPGLVLGGQIVTAEFRLMPLDQTGKEKIDEKVNQEVSEILAKKNELQLKLEADAK